MRRIALFAVVIVALVGALLVVVLGRPAVPERDGDGVDVGGGDERRADVELAASADAAGHDGRAVVDGDELELHTTSTEAVGAAAEATSPLPCGVRVVWGNEPVAGATVELVHATTGAVLQLVTGDDGFAAVEEGTFDRGPWRAIAGVRGLCNRGLVPVEIDGELRQPEVLVFASSHLALRFERSDFAPVVRRAGELRAVEAALQVESSSDRFVRVEPGDGRSDSLSLRCLALAGLHDHGLVDEHLVWQSRERGPPDQTVRSTWYQVDAASTFLEFASQPVELGGALAVVPLVVDPNVRLATVEIAVVGAPVANPVERCRNVSVVFDVGERRWIRSLTVSRGARFTLPEGRFEARLALGTFGSTMRLAHSTERVPCTAPADRIEVVTFDLAEFGAIELTGAGQLDLDDARVSLVDVSQESTTSVAVVHDAPLVLLRAGTYVGSFAGPRGLEPLLRREFEDRALPTITGLDVPTHDLRPLQRAIVRSAGANTPELAPLFEHFRLDVSAGAVTVAVPFTP
jgi:hypothetical protein